MTVPVMPVISFGLPTSISGDLWVDPARAVDTDPSTDWRQVDANPQWFAIDVSGIADADKEVALFHWYNIATGAYWNTAAQSSNEYNNLPRNYTLDTNTGAGGGAAPGTGWSTVVTVTNNTYRSRVHTLDLSGINWVRIRITASNGAPGNDDVSMQINIHNGAAGVDDHFRVIGDSITQDGLPEARTGGGAWQNGNVAEQINDALPERYPIWEPAGRGGMTADWFNTNKANLLANFTGKYVGIAIGTNDANQEPALSQGAIDAFETDLLAIVDHVIGLGKIPIVAKIPWGSASNGGLGVNANTLNTQVIQALYDDETRPEVIEGPDLYTLYDSNHALISGDGIHPTLDVGGGYDKLNDTWAETLVDNLYSVIPPDPPTPPAPEVKYGRAQVSITTRFGASPVRTISSGGYGGEQASNASAGFGRPTVSNSGGFGARIVQVEE